MKFRSKPFIIEAHQWFKNGDHPLDRVGEQVREPLSDRNDQFYTRVEGALVRFFRHPSWPGHMICVDCGKRYHDHGYIDTAQGGHKVCPGDWIIPESKSPGKFYPCKPDVFAQKYEVVA